MKRVGIVFPDKKKPASKSKKGKNTEAIEEVIEEVEIAQDPEVEDVTEEEKAK